MGKLKKILLKELCPWTVHENSFEAGVSGGSGAISYAAPYGTPQGGNYSQTPDHFSSSDKTVNHFNNQQSGSSAIAKLPDRVSSSGSPIHPASTSDKGDFENPDTEEKPNHMVSLDKDDGGKPERINAPDSDLSIASPGAQFDKIQSEKPLNPDQTYDKDVDKIFKKKQTPSPDEIMSSLQYELGNMVKKDKTIAKRMVLKNLKDNPHYYSQLNMLNIDDKKMKVDESTVAKTKSVLDQMIAERQSRKPQPLPYLDNIFKGLHKKRYGIPFLTK